MTQDRRSHGVDRCLGPRPSPDVTAWRRCRLLEAGFDPTLADGLAGNRCVDLHALLQLVDRGCPPALAARILGPTEDAEALG